MAAGLAIAPSGSEAKTPGHTYCFLGVCHRVQTLAETRAAVGKTQIVHASYYFEAGKDRFNPSNITSSGEYFHAGRPDNAASPILPNGTKVLIWHPVTRQAAVIRINNAGPYWGRRTIDLSRATADKLGMLRSGVAAVHMRVLEAPSAAEATYRRGRVYPPVPGHLGWQASMDVAQLTAARALRIDPPAADNASLVAALPVDPMPRPDVVAVARLEPPAELGAGDILSVEPVPIMPRAPAATEFATVAHAAAAARPMAEERTTSVQAVVEVGGPPVVTGSIVVATAPAPRPEPAGAVAAATEPVSRALSAAVHTAKPIVAPAVAKPLPVGPKQVVVAVRPVKAAAAVANARVVTSKAPAIKTAAAKAPVAKSARAAVRVAAKPAALPAPAAKLKAQAVAAVEPRTAPKRAPAPTQVAAAQDFEPPVRDGNWVARALDEPVR